ncbi:uncharacterized protein LOC128739658 [Sabethes cyaneus]|uniref:uncharacterized protein LOC128739658 n=1 Tax=Sabethes cyaneus TaxID=53552 RepID=UPI00237DC0C3|nr:uncharacterized protein LOC128739658 [Sabethes cyaneus]
MTRSDLRKLTKRERQLLDVIESIEEFVQQYQDERDKGSVLARLKKLEQVYDEYCDVRGDIEIVLEECDTDDDTGKDEAAATLSAVTKAQRTAAKIADRRAQNSKILKAFVNRYFKLKQSLEMVLHEASSGVQNTLSTPTNTPATASALRVKLPELTIPTFRGAHMEWITFRDTFKNLIGDNPHLSDIDRFTYLRTSLAGEALQQIASIDLTANNYSVAWNSLESRYENKKLLVKSHLDALFAVNSMKKESFEALNYVIGEFEKHLQMLKKLGENTNAWSTLLAYMLASKLDSTTLRLWETEHRSTDVATYDDMIKFLSNHRTVLLSISGENRVSAEPKRQFKVSSSYSVQQQSCPFCDDEQHFAYQCKRFKAMRVDERRNAVNSNNLCFNCLAHGHTSKFCSRGTCRVCGQRHHSLLHINIRTNEQQSLESNKRSQQNEQNPQSNQTLSIAQQQKPTLPSSQQSFYQSPEPYVPVTGPNMQTPPHTDSPNVVLTAQEIKSSRSVLLATAVLILEDNFGNTMQARALLDSGSQLCFVSERAAQRLKFKRSRETLSISGIGQVSKQCKQSIFARIRSRISSFIGEEIFYVLPQVTLNLPIRRIDSTSLQLPDGIALADPHFMEPGGIDVIIGAGLFFDLLHHEKIRLGEDGPIAQNTTLGWIVCGNLPVETDARRPHVANACTERLDDLLTRFWELESCKTNSILSLEEYACEKLFDRTTVRDATGRFIVTLPKKDFLIRQLGDSKSSALRRFLSLERRLDLNPELKLMYSEFIHEYLRMGHMEEVVADEEDAALPQYFIPHHCVIKADSTTTKLRVVFDASCITSTGVSLNNALMVGPTVQDDIISIVLRFRLHRIAIVADAEKMYRMVLQQWADRKLHKIFWRDHRSDDIRVFQLNTVTYGTASAPYLATKCLKRLAELDGHKYPNAARILAKDFYVDDMMTGVDCVEDGVKLCSDMQQLMKGGGFNLRKWSSNCPAVLVKIPAELHDDRVSFELDDSSATIKTLGLIWEPRIDVFRFKAPEWTSSAICKRTVISDLAKIFDPIGLIAVVIVSAKIFVQTLWKQKVSWDEPLQGDLQTQWIEFRTSLSKLEMLQIPRWIEFRKDCLSLELHGFCDASTKAYGACIYVRCRHTDGTITSNLLVAKSRVAPLAELEKKRKQLTIPRLELSSAVLLAHLYEKTAASISVSAQAYFHTDSMIVRYWLSSNPSRYQMFVANRISEVQHLTKNGTWRHIAGTDNPADFLSRGVSPSDLVHSSLWWEGPNWLKQEKLYWPQAQEVVLEELNRPDLEEDSTVSSVCTVSPPSDIFSLRSTLHRLERLVALLMRFKHNALHVRETNCKMSGPVTLGERETALLHLVKLSQQECFAQELEDLARNKEVKLTSRIRTLHPRLVDGVLRVGGRLENADITTDRKHPILLDKNHPLTTMIMRRYHFEHLHAGPQLLVASVRERFWPLSAKSLARSIVHKCITCFRSKPTVHEQLMADLPAERVTPAPPFLRVGVDYCGPFLINYPNRRKIPIKHYAAIFVCLVTKAVHIEMVADLTTQGFLAALRRFVARRGKPALIMCDNGTNLVGARRQLDELTALFRNQESQHSISSGAADDGIAFKFIPANSPNFGGLWEAAVKSMKQHLQKVIGLRTVAPDELNTVLTQIEACLNSRPLTQMSNDPSDLDVLTPGHFLVQRPLTAVAGPWLQHISENRLARWQQTEDFVQRVWTRWSTQYLSDLHNRTKWTKQRNNLAVGAMVLIREDNLPPLKWLLGRVTQVLPGADGNVRVARVRTKHGEIVRAISKICILPISDNEQPPSGEN